MKRALFVGAIAAFVIGCIVLLVRFRIEDLKANSAATDSAAATLVWPKNTNDARSCCELAELGIPRAG
jgi:hypothetical protein